MWTVQVMAELVERHELALAHFALSLLHHRALFGGEDVVRIDHALRLHEYTAPVRSKRHEITFAHLQLFENLPWNDHLSPLANAPNAFSRWRRRFACHTFRLSDRQTVKHDVVVGLLPVDWIRWSSVRLNRAISMRSGRFRGNLPGGRRSISISIALSPNKKAQSAGFSLRGRPRPGNARSCLSRSTLPFGGAGSPRDCFKTSWTARAGHGFWKSAHRTWRPSGFTNRWASTRLGAEKTIISILRNRLLS